SGFLHLGGLRTALYNYLFAKSHNGKFILRIEDTDTARTIPESIEGIQNDLQWLSLTPDESPNNGGSFGPYVQSERAHLYQKYAEELLQKNSAYKCFCSLDRLRDLRKASLSYDNKCRSLTPEQVEILMKKNVHYCIRLKEKKEDHLNDLIFGARKINVPHGEGDPVIVKTCGLPTYHFANVIDDHLMQISHVFRGDEWLSSVAKHLQLYRCLNWTPPSFGHLPQILNPDGSKLSKRQEGLHVHSLREEGFSPEAILNFVKLSGGGFADIDHEKMFSLTQLVQKVWLEHVYMVWLEYVQRVWLEYVYKVWLEYVHKVWLEYVHKVWLGYVYKVWLEYVHKVWLGYVHKVWLEYVQRVWLEYVYKVWLEYVHKVWLRYVYKVWL
ncbi:UNVERIFIED_CONTAM: hypothetical protein GTU68_033448, partial [Idotea baltica]|nr:hypothetical protein [Idotea baltica]